MLWTWTGSTVKHEADEGDEAQPRNCLGQPLVVLRVGAASARLPDLATWYLTTNLPAPGSGRGIASDLLPASVAEVVRLYGLRMWVEQSYKQVKHALGWSGYQVRSDAAIRLHWQLVCCAFSLCWWAFGRSPTDKAEPAERPEEDLPAG